VVKDELTNVSHKIGLWDDTKSENLSYSEFNGQ
jgi:hypothetical protein